MVPRKQHLRMVSWLVIQVKGQYDWDEVMARAMIV